MRQVLGIFLFIATIFALESFFTRKRMQEASAPAPADAVQVSPTAPAFPPALIFKEEDSAQKKMDEFFMTTPGIASLHEITDAEAHGMPEPVRQAGEQLAEMRSFFITHPQPAKIELGFYLKCSNSEEMFDSVKAVCAARVSQKYLELTGKKISPALFSPKVAYLKDRISI